jgi:hypothetical protein
MICRSVVRMRNELEATQRRAKIETTLRYRSAITATPDFSGARKERVKR